MLELFKYSKYNLLLNPHLCIVSTDVDVNGNSFVSETWILTLCYLINVNSNADVNSNLYIPLEMWMLVSTFFTGVNSYPYNLLQSFHANTDGIYRDVKHKSMLQANYKYNSIWPKQKIMNYL